ncbi:MAG TPA: DUF3828 domain-containing protein [Parvularculaceae bacterium]|nr:DUF3828 domain-containing protein [Parvularculaceae bacterium]
MKRQLIWAAVAAAACANAFAGETPPVHGKWRITRIVQGPWATADSYLPSSAQLIGESVTFMRGEIVAPRPVGCWRATYTSYDAPVEEMFQSAGIGKDGAIALGVKGPTISSFSVSCSEGLYEYHRVTASSILVGIDNQVWTLDRTAGTRASARSPEGVVQRFLERHFAGAMEFQKDAVSEKREFFTDAFVAKMAAYLASNKNADEPPVINGDPFTDSQEYPARFAVGGDKKKEPGILVPVEFSDAFASKTVRYDLKREGGRWRIDDLVFEDGTRLSEHIGE